MREVVRRRGMKREKRRRTVRCTDSAGRSGRFCFRFRAVLLIGIWYGEFPGKGFSVRILCRESRSRWSIILWNTCRLLSDHGIVLSTLDAAFSVMWNICFVLQSTVYHTASSHTTPGVFLAGTRGMSRLSVIKSTL